MLHLAFCIALGILLAPVLLSDLSLALAIIVAPFAIIRHEIKLWSK